MKVEQTKVRPGQYCLYKELNTALIGNILAFDIFIKKSDDYIIILEAGTVLSESLYNKLTKQENLYIFTKDKGNTTLTCKSLKSYIHHNRDDLKSRIELLHKINTEIFDNFLSNTDNKIDMSCVILLLKSIIYLIKYDENFLKNTIPNFSNNHDLINHSLHVAVYAMSIGNKLNLGSKQLLQLGISGILHDVGLKKIDKILLEKTTELEISETEEIQKHPLWSVEMIKQNNIIDPIIIDAILHHHEQQDGAGYPNRLNADKISDFASILSICDVFDALTGKRSYREAYTSFEAIKMMLKDQSMAQKFNREYLQILLKSI